MINKNHKDPSSAQCSKSAKFFQITLSKKFIMKVSHSKSVLYEFYIVDSEKIISSYENQQNIWENSNRNLNFRK